MTSKREEIKDTEIQLEALNELVDKLKETKCPNCVDMLIEKIAVVEAMLIGLKSER